jgi:hypothetical protein
MISDLRRIVASTKSYPYAKSARVAVDISTHISELNAHNQFEQCIVVNKIAKKNTLFSVQRKATPGTSRAGSG